MRRPYGDAAPYALLIAIWGASLLLWMTPGYVRPDGAGYASYLPSAWFDHDLVLFNEWGRFGMIRGQTIAFTNVTANGHLSDHWTAGPATVWFPAFVAADAARLLLPMLHRFGRNGFSLPYATALLTTSAIAGLLTLLLGVAIARKTSGAFAATLAAIGIWFGSPLLWYSVRHATMAHAISAAACAVAVTMALAMRNGVTAQRLFGTGLACGFAFAMRPQNLTFVLVPVILIGFRPLLRRSWIAAIGFIIGALPELVVSQVIYGNPLAFASSGGANDWHSFERVHPFLSFVSWYHGMFTWTPLLALALAGLLLLWRDDRRVAIAGITMFVLQWLIVIMFDRSFWGMNAFGQRRFDQCTIFFLLGLAALLQRLPRWLAILVSAIGCGWTMLLFLAAPRLDLNAYVPPRALWTAITATFRDGSTISVLQAVAPAARTATLVVLVLTLAVVAAVIGVARRHVAVSAAYLVAAGLYLAWCGSHDAAHLAPWLPIVEANRGDSAGDGHALDYLGLLRFERDYFRAVGDDEEAARSEKDARDFANAAGRL